MSLQLWYDASALAWALAAVWLVTATLVAVACLLFAREERDGVEDALELGGEEPKGLRRGRAVARLDKVDRAHGVDFDALQESYERELLKRRIGHGQAPVDEGVRVFPEPLPERRACGGAGQAENSPKGKRSGFLLDERGALKPPSVFLLALLLSGCSLALRESAQISAAPEVAAPTEIELQRLVQMLLLKQLTGPEDVWNRRRDIGCRPVVWRQVVIGPRGPTIRQVSAEGC